MNDVQTTYQAFLLRLRWANNAGHPIWRISIERPGQPGEIQLEGLSDLCAYLTAQMQIDGEKGGDATENECSTTDPIVDDS